MLLSDSQIKAQTGHSGPVVQWIEQAFPKR
jgi:hypothetical protein